MKNRCEWAEKEIFHKYHDNEWCKKSADDTYMFEMLTLEGAQAGLSWETILRRREGYRKAFKNFDVKKVAKMSEKDVEALMENKEIIRNRLKIKSTISNAKAFIEVQKEYGTFSMYIWSFTKNKSIVTVRKSIKGVLTTIVSEQISKDLKKKGFAFAGPTIVYSFLQSIGVVNDHEKKCFCTK